MEEESLVGSDELFDALSEGITYDIPAYRNKQAMLDEYLISRFSWGSSPLYWYDGLNETFRDAIESPEKPTRVLSRWYENSSLPKTKYDVLVGILTKYSKSDMTIKLGVLDPKHLGNGEYGDSTSCFGEGGENRGHVDGLIYPLFRKRIVIPVKVHMIRGSMDKRSRFLLNWFGIGAIGTNFYGSISEDIYQKERDGILFRLLSRYVSVRDIRYIYPNVRTPYYMNKYWVAMADKNKLDEFDRSLKIKHKGWCVCCLDAPITMSFVRTNILCDSCVDEINQDEPVDEDDDQ